MSGTLKHAAAKAHTIVSSIGTHCFWDRHEIPEGCGMGCPVRSVPTEVTKRYDSRDNRTAFVIKDRITSEDREKLGDVHKESYYECEGSFCSVGCCMAYVGDNHRGSFGNSVAFLMKMTGSSEPIVPAPHWRTLKAYGGEYSISEFRKITGNMVSTRRGSRIISSVFDMGATK
jgi:hypothetical protein